MTTQEFVAIGREHLAKGELALAKKQARTIAENWESSPNAPSDEEWNATAPFLAEILAMQSIWASFQLKPKTTRKFLEDAKAQTAALAEQAQDNLKNLFG